MENPEKEIYMSETNRASKAADYLIWKNKGGYEKEVMKNIEYFNEQIEEDTTRQLRELDKIIKEEILNNPNIRKNFEECLFGKIRKSG